MKHLLCSLFLFYATAFADPLEVTVDFFKPDGAWDMPALALGQGGLQGDPMIAPHIKELKQRRPRTVRLFLSEYYRIYPAHGVYDFTKLDRELEAVVATGARPTLAVAIKPPVLFPVVDQFKVQKLDMAAYYHIRDCFVDPADFDCMSPGGINFMAHWWNTMPQYSALFDHHGRVRPAWYAFRLPGQFEEPRFARRRRARKHPRHRRATRASAAHPRLAL